MNGAKSAWLESSNGQRTVLGASCFLGRSASCEMVLAHEKVSRQHALLQRQNENEFWLIDLGSVNGTYLNGQRVRHPCRLADGDSIAIAGFTLDFHCQAAPGRSGAEPTTEPTVHEVRSQTCWLLVADIEGSTLLLRKLPAEEAPRVTGKWLAACGRILKEHRGTINKFLGDGFLAYWPATSTPPQSVADALLALKQLQDRGDPPFRIVLHSGQVSVSGIASLGEEGLSGSDLNFVFRMEKLAAKLSASRLLSESAHEKLAPVLSTSSEGSHELAGFDGEFAFYSF